MLTKATWTDGERTLALTAAMQAGRWIASHPAVSVPDTWLADPWHADRVLVARARAVLLVSAISGIQSYPHGQFLR